MRAALIARCFVAVGLLGCRSQLDDSVPSGALPVTRDAATQREPPERNDPSPSDLDARVEEGARDAGRKEPIDPPEHECVSPDALAPLTVREPSELCFELLAHNGDFQGDPLQVLVGESVSHLYYDIPWPDGMIATRYGVQLAGDASPHRALLFEVGAGHHGLVDAQSTGTVLGMDATFIAGWSVGGCNVELPTDVGLALPDPANGRTLLVHWHHRNDTNRTQLNESRLQLCAVPRARRPVHASVTLLGTESLGGAEGIPVGVESTFDSTCVNKSGQPITLLGVWPQMHQLATHATLKLGSGGGALTTLLSAPFQHDRNVHYALEPRVVVQPGDRLVASCTYLNTTAFGVPYGMSISMEQCYHYVVSYPAGMLDEPGNLSLIGARNTCWDDE